MATTGDIRKDTGRTIFGWIKSRFPTVPYAELTRVFTETDQRQVPRSHAEKYELKTIWYWYPLYCLGGISFVAFIVLTITGILFGYSGYLLPANALSEGAANIGINMTRASPAIGDQLATLLFGDINTLSGVYILRWYWIHVFILPLVGTGLMVLHMGLVWLQGVAEPH